MPRANNNFATVHPMKEDRSQETMQALDDMRAAAQSELIAKQEQAFKQAQDLNETFTREACTKLKDFIAFFRAYSYNIQFNEVQKNFIFMELTNLASEHAPEVVFSQYSE